MSYNLVCQRMVCTLQFHGIDFQVGISVGLMKTYHVHQQRMEAIKFRKWNIRSESVEVIQQEAKDPRVKKSKSNN